MNVQHIYRGDLAPRLGLVTDGPDEGRLVAHSGSEWIFLTDKRRLALVAFEPAPEPAKEKKPKNGKKAT